MVTNNAINISAAGIVEYDGAGTFTSATTTPNALLIGASSNGITSLTLTSGEIAIGRNGLAPLATTLSSSGGIAISTSSGIISVGTSLNTNGQMIIGSSSGPSAPGTITSTGGTIAVTTGANTLNLEVAAGGFTWTDATGATQALAVENGYITDRGGGVTYTLPATATLGAEIKIVGKLGLATITPNANQQILIGSGSGAVGVTGTAVSNNVGDCIELICITSGASTVWRANAVVGTWTLN